jgi:uncharacterized membrane protein YdjX (TVP38/TMEM64 family)
MKEDKDMADTTASPPSSAGNSLKKFLPLVILAAGAVIGFTFLSEYLSFETLKENRESLLAWRDDNYLLAAATYMLAYVAIVAFSIPGAAFMTLTGGFLFGLIAGTLLTVFGATIGAACIFLAAKTSLGASLKERAGPWMEKFEKGFQENEISFLFLLRLVPALPFFVANLLPAFFGVKLFTYVWTTFLGILPGTAVYTSIGTGLGEVFAKGEDLSLNVFADPAVWGPFAGLTFLAVLPIIIKKVRGKPAIAGDDADV